MVKKSNKSPLELNELTFESLPESLKRLGELQRNKTELQSEADQKISEIQEELAKQLDPIDAEIKQISLSIKSYMDDNRTKLLSEDRKTLNLETGDLSYRKAGASVKTKSSQKLIDQILETNGLTKVRDTFFKKMSKVFLRAKLELDKESILKNPQEGTAITGVEIEDGIERFYLKPYSTKIEMEVI